MRDHTLNGPSSLSRRAICPGSLAQEAEVADDKQAFDEDADSGSNCHKAMEHAILSKEKVDLTDDEYAKCKFAWKALEFVLQGDEIIEDGKRTRSGGIVYVEHRFERLPYSYANNDEIGTIDLGIDYQDHFLLMDWKFGGSFVPAPRWNWQFKGYALGVWGMVGRKPIHVACVQPEAMGDYRIVPDIYEPHQYSEFMRDITGIIERCHRSPDALVVGKGCQFCKAARRATCPRLQEAMGLFAGLPQDWARVVESADMTHVARLLTACKAAKKNCEALIEAVKNRTLTTGEEPPGYSATPTAKGNIRLAARAEYPGWPEDISKGEG